MKRDKGKIIPKLMGWNWRYLCELLILNIEADIRMSVS